MSRSCFSPVHKPLLALVLCGLLGPLGAGCPVPDDRYCVTNQECLSKDPSRPYCDTLNHFCRSGGDGGSVCTTDDGCSTADRPRCDGATLQCAPCTDNTSCRHLKNPPRPFCLPQAGVPLCVECMSSADCTDPNRPICQKDTHACRPCGAHSECDQTAMCNDKPCTSKQTGSQVCISRYEDRDDLVPLGGRCAGDGNSGQVIYVKGPVEIGGCSDNNPGTSLDAPLCSLQTGIDRANTDGRAYVRIVGVYSPVQLTIGSTPRDRLILVGASIPPSTMPATLQNMGPVVQVLSGAKVTLDSLRIMEKGPNVTAVSCEQAALILRNSTVLGATGMNDGVSNAGVSLTNCEVVMDGNVIGITQRGQTTAHGNGVSIVAQAQHTYLLQNNIIAGNIGSALDLSAASAAVLTFRFNTLVGNGVKKVFGGVLCPGASSQLLSNSIISGNYPGLDGTQFFQMNNNCTFDKVVVGSAEKTLFDPAQEIKIDPDLTPDFRLKPGDKNSPNGKCCINMGDKAVGKPGQVPADHDIDGHPRPRPGDTTGWDIGASQLQ